MLITKLSAKFGQSVGLGLDSSASMLYNEIILLRNRRNTFMTKHIILWQLADTLTADEKITVKAGIKEGLEGLAGQIPGLVDI